MKQPYDKRTDAYSMYGMIMNGDNEGVVEAGHAKATQENLKRVITKKDKLKNLLYWITEIESEGNYRLVQEDGKWLWRGCDIKMD
jgi:hypothetical protein